MRGPDGEWDGSKLRDGSLVIRNDVVKGFTVIHPNSPNKVAWDLWISACIFYSVITVPFMIGKARGRAARIARARRGDTRAALPRRGDVGTCPHP